MNPQINYFEANRMGATLLPACLQTMKAPRTMFASMPGTAYFRDGLALLTIIVLTGSLITIPFSGFTLAFMVPFIWGAVLLSSWAMAGYLSWAVTSFSDRRLSTMNAFQIIAYASIPLTLSLLPYVAIPASLWSLYLIWLGLVARAGISGAKATLFIGLPLILMIIMLGLAAAQLLPMLDIHLQ